MKGFDDIALAYDHSIDWETRIRREVPFIVEMAEGVKGKRILDLACGTGRHTIELDKRGARVTGIDNSPAMIDTAREIAKEQGSNAEFVVADMSDMKQVVSDKFDLVLCLGNSLALLSDFGTIEQVMSDVHDRLVPEGTFLYQILNFEEILRSQFRFMQPKARQSRDGSNVVFFRFFTHPEESRYSTLVLSAFENGDDWDVRMHTLNVLRMDYSIVRVVMNQAGFEVIKTFSSYDGSPFDRRNNRNLIVVTKK
ncbi:MAG: methyltransferase domain-containing protein [Candidatus Thorarchaeota archaeon]